MKLEATLDVNRSENGNNQAKKGETGQNEGKNYECEKQSKVTAN